MTARPIREPIIFIGSVRSGTSMLAGLVGRHPDVAYLPEPRPIWMHGNAYRRDDVLGRDDVKPRNADYIDRRFAEFLARSEGTRFAEKTPSNCLRIPFIHELYPDCRVVNIIRDGRDVVRSTLQIMKRKPNKGRVTARLRETPIWEWPGYVPMLLRTVWRTNILGRPATHWGPRPHGWREWMKLPPHQAGAHLWNALVEASIRDGRALPRENYYETRYEKLIRDPEGELDGVFRFTGLPPAPEIAEWARNRIDPQRSRLWVSTLTEEQEREVEEIERPLLEELGYVDATAAPGV